MYQNCFSKDDYKKMKVVIKDKKVINYGVMVAPVDQFIAMCKECDHLIKKSKYMADQISINYILHRDGFKILPNLYNFFVSESSEKDFYIEKGEFFLKDGTKIPIVHNVGNVGLARAIKNFGYGEDRNKLCKATHFIKRNIYALNKKPVKKVLLPLR